LEKFFNLDEFSIIGYNSGMAKETNKPSPESIKQASAVYEAYVATLPEFLPRTPREEPIEQTILLTEKRLSLYLRAQGAINRGARRENPLTAITIKHTSGEKIAEEIKKPAFIAYEYVPDGCAIIELTFPNYDIRNLFFDSVPKTSKKRKPLKVSTR